MTDLQNSKIPEGWKRARLGDIANVRKERGIKKGSPYLEIGDIDIAFKKYRLLEKPSPDIPNIAYKNDIVISKVRPTRGAISLIIHDKIFISPALCCLNTLENSKYLYYALSRKKFFNFLGARETGTTYPSVNDNDILEYYLVIPPLPEQRKIAEILETIDRAIEKTDKIIEKYKHIKQGFMQDLLTKGIDENGNIRDEKTHKFKDSPLGRIPEEWEIKKDFIKIFSGYGFALKEYSEDGIFLIRIDNIGHGKLIHENFAYLPEKYKQSYERFLINRGDVLLALNRPITREKLKIAKVDLNNAILYQRVGKLLFRNETEKNFYFYYMQSNFFIKQLELSLVGSDQPYITETDFKDLLFKFPPFPEQQRIAQILTKIDNTIEKEQKYKEKLIKIKNGLMEDLLTGKIRVNHLIQGEDVKNVSQTG